MFPIELYLLLSIGLISATILFYISKVKEFNINYLKYIIPIWILALFIIFLFSFDMYVNSNLSGKEYRIGITFISQLILFISVGLFIISVNYKDEDIIDLPYPSLLKSKKGSINIGKIVNRNENKYSFFLSQEDLEKHMFVCGATGMGKSNFVQNFLINFTTHHTIPFLLIEFKSEYIFLKDLLDNVFILHPGENFSINVFNPEGANPEIHAERIFDILKSGQFLDETAEYSPQMQKVLVDILTEVCKNRELQNWEGFYKQCGDYLREERNKVPMLAQTLISIRNRIRRFSIGPLKSIFGTKTEFKVKDLFQRNVIIDLSSIIRLGGEKEDALFFLNMILKYLWDRNIAMGAIHYKGIKHLTIVEDAQYFAPKDLTTQTKLSTYLEDIALLQRGTGECLISIATRPQVSEEILANCGVLVIFKNHMEKQLQCELLNLDETYEYYLSILKKGHGIIRTNSVKRPFLLKIPYIDRNPLFSIEKNQALSNTIENSSNFKKKVWKSKRKYSKEEKNPLHLKKKQKNNNSLDATNKLEMRKEPPLKELKIEFNKRNTTSIFENNTNETEDGQQGEKIKEFERFIQKIHENEKNKTIKLWEK